MVDDDMVWVDLNWWNEHLARKEIGVRVVARDRDGALVQQGKGYLRRGDLADDTGALGLCDPLTRLYQCAAWLIDHPYRGRARRFPDTRDRHGRTKGFSAINGALRILDGPLDSIEGSGPRQWSGWPLAPGVGPVQMSLYCWAVHQDEAPRPQLLDQRSVTMLIRLGWINDRPVQQFLPRDYLRYNAVLQRWAERAGCRAELVEMWLNRTWRELNAEARGEQRLFR